MLLLIAFIILFIIGIVVILKTDEYSGIHFTGFIVSMIFGILAFIMLIALPINHYNGVDNIQQYNAIKETIEVSRSQKISDVERASLITKIIEINQDLASSKYWNGTTFDWFINDDYANLDYLK